MVLLTIKELADELKVSKSTINRLLAKGMPKIYVGGQLRFKFDEIETWLENNSKNKD